MDEEVKLLTSNLDDWEGNALPFITKKVKPAVHAIRTAMEAEPPDLYSLSNSIIELSHLNIRLIDRIITAKSNWNQAKFLYELRREEWKVKLVQGYEGNDPVGVGMADSMKVSMVIEEFKLMDRAEYNYEQVNLLRRAIEKALDAARSKLSYEKNHET